MVCYSLPALALLALATSVAAIPATSTTSVTPFTFVQWIENIIADPNGDHLTPEEAVAAKNAAVADANPLAKRAWCQAQFKDANANDAAGCLKYLADLGALGWNCDLGQYEYDRQVCIIGNAKMVISKGASTPQGANCNDVARTGGLIFDTCWRSDNTVKGSEYCVSNNMFQVNILGV